MRLSAFSLFCISSVLDAALTAIGVKPSSLIPHSVRFHARASMKNGIVPVFGASPHVEAPNSICAAKGGMEIFYEAL
jgi:hypothetical protein